jgi:hypothetical protein
MMLLVGAGLCFIVMIVKDTIYINITNNHHNEDSTHYIRKLSEDSSSLSIVPSHHYHNIPLRKSRKYYIDFGANSGDTVEHFMNPKQKNEGQFALYNYDIRGRGSDGDWHIVAIEANPKYTSSLEQLKASYIQDKKVHSFELFAGTAIFTRYDSYLYDDEYGDEHDDDDFDDDNHYVQLKVKIHVLYFFMNDIHTNFNSFYYIFIIL